MGNFRKIKYQQVEKTTTHPEAIMDKHLKALGFVYRAGMWFKDGVSIQFDRWMWRVSKAGHETKEIKTLPELYNKYWEFTGKVLAPLT